MVPPILMVKNPLTAPPVIPVGPAAVGMVRATAPAAVEEKTLKLTLPAIPAPDKFPGASVMSPPFVEEPATALPAVMITAPGVPALEEPPALPAVSEILPPLVAPEPEVALPA